MIPGCTFDKRSGSRCHHIVVDDFYFENHRVVSEFGVSMVDFYEIAGQLTTDEAGHCLTPNRPTKAVSMRRYF